MKKGFGLVGVLIVVGVIVLGGGYYYSQTPKQKISRYTKGLNKCLAKYEELFGEQISVQTKDFHFGNIKDCEIASEVSYHPNCYLKAKDSCYSGLGVATGDFKYCKMVKDKREREGWCYDEIAYYHKKPEACEEITTNERREACLSLQTNSSQEIIDENQGERYVNFCGQSHKTKIKISHLNMTDTFLGIIENIAKTGNPSLICNYINNNMPGHEIGIAYKKWGEQENISATEKQEKDTYQVVMYKEDVEREKLDPFNQSTVQFKFDLNKKEVYLKNQFSGELNLIGNF